MNTLKLMSDRDLLEAIYVLLLSISRRLHSPEENLNDFTMNIIANVFADRLINNGTEKK